MTSRNRELIELAQGRRLTLAERAELDLDDLSDVDSLALVEATAGGAQRLDRAEAERLFSRATRRAPARSLRPRWTGAGLALALAAGVAALVLFPRLDPSGGPSLRTKGGAVRVSVRLAAQRPGSEVARPLPESPTLEPGEALRVVVTTTAPAHLALYELDGGAPSLLWTSGATPVPAGERLVGPDASAGLSLSKGHSVLLVVGRDQPLPAETATSVAGLTAECPDCFIEPLEVVQQ